MPTSVSTLSKPTPTTTHTPNASQLAQLATLKATAATAAATLAAARTTLATAQAASITANNAVVDYQAYIYSGQRAPSSGIIDDGNAENT